VYDLAFRRYQWYVSMESVLTDGMKMQVSKQERWCRRRRRSDVRHAVSRPSPQQQGKDQGTLLSIAANVKCSSWEIDDMQSTVSYVSSSACINEKITGHSPTSP
jgi:hypothetical protein